jgi:hypothetical protein
MTYAISGLPRDSFARFFAMSNDELAALDARSVVADADRGFPCRITLDDAPAGERLILLNYVSHDAASPYRTAYAIYVSESGIEPAPFVDSLPPYLANRALSLRAFGADDYVTSARLVPDGEADAAIRSLFADPNVAYIMAHFAAYGCFAARIERCGHNAGESA